MEIKINIEKISGKGFKRHFFWEVASGDSVLSGREDSLSFAMTDIEGCIYELAEKEIGK
jgi:hypothetical protein